MKFIIRDDLALKFVKIILLCFLLPLNLSAKVFTQKITSPSNYQFEFNKFKQRIILKLQERTNRNFSTNKITIHDDYIITIIENLITYDKKKKIFEIDLEKLDIIILKKFKMQLKVIENKRYIENDLERIISDIDDFDKLILPCNFDFRQKSILENKLENIKNEIRKIRIKPTDSINVLNGKSPKIPIVFCTFKDRPIKNLAFKINGKEFISNDEGKIFVKNVSKYRSINLEFDVYKSFNLSKLINTKFFKKIIDENLNFHKKQIQINIFSRPSISNTDVFFDNALQKKGYKISRKKSNYEFKIKYMTISAGKSQIQGYFAKIQSDAYILKKNKILKHYKSVASGLSLISIKDAKKTAMLKTKNDILHQLKNSPK